jgi:hypothetical protein
MSNLPEKQLRDLIDRALMHARQVMVQHGQVPPVFTIIGREAQIIPCDFASEANKEMMALMVRELVKLNNAHTVLLISETWTLPEGTTGDVAASLYKKYGQLANMPQRVECVMVSAETRDGQSWLALASIVRKGRAVQLGEAKYMDMSGEDLQSSGRFAGWFAPEVRAHPDDFTKKQEAQ